MRDLILAQVRGAAEELGLPPGRVMGKSLADNITLPRPRMELDFLPETFSPTGRLQGGAKDEAGASLFRWERYEVSLPVAALILADDEAWLKDFTRRLLGALPGGFIDGRDNYVRLRAAQGTWENFGARRVGTAVIEPIVKRGYLLHLTAVWRVSEEEAVKFVERINFNVKGVE